MEQYWSLNSVMNTDIYTYKKRKKERQGDHDNSGRIKVTKGKNTQDLAIYRKESVYSEVI